MGCNLERLLGPGRPLAGGSLASQSFPLAPPNPSPKFAPAFHSVSGPPPAPNQFWTEQKTKLCQDFQSKLFGTQTLYNFYYENPGFEPKATRAQSGLAPNSREMVCDSSVLAAPNWRRHLHVLLFDLGSTYQCVETAAELIDNDSSKANTLASFKNQTDPTLLQGFHLHSCLENRAVPDKYNPAAWLYRTA